MSPLYFGMGVAITLKYIHYACILNGVHGNNNNNNHFGTNATVFNYAVWITLAVMAYSPPCGGNYFIKSFLFIPYPATPPYYVRTIHPGIRPTKKTYMLDCC